MAATILVLVIFVAYSRVKNAGFIWDDEAHLTENPCIIGPLGFNEIWTTTHAVYYPLVLTMFWVLHKFVALNPVPYHLLNVVWHAASALMLWRVLRQLRVRGAGLGAALWALHPVMTQSVAWITEMKNTQSAFFYLLSISLFLSWWERRSRASSRRVVSPLYLLALLSFCAAITSKPSTVILPAVLALCLWWNERRLSWPRLRALVPFVLVSLVAAGWTIWEQKFHAGASGAEWAQTPLQRALISANALWFYLLKLIWPQPLIFIYPRWSIDTASWVSYLPSALLVITGIFLVIGRRRLRPIIFALAYFVVALFPVLDFFDVYFFRYSFVSDHFQYLASMGPLALAGTLLTTIGQNRVRAIVSALLLFLLLILTFQQSGKYHDAITLYRVTLQQNPACWMANYNLGIALRNNGDLDGATEQYQRAIETRPDYVEAHYNLGSVLIAKGDVPGALVHYKRAIEIKPDDPDSHNNYGSALRQTGRFDEAELEYRRALQLRTDYFDAELNLGILLLQKNRTNEAIAVLQKAASSLPNYPPGHTSLGNAYMKAGRAREAVEEFSRALLLAPDHLGTLNSLAWLLATSSDASIRDGARAAQLANRASELTKNGDPLILHTLAAAYAEAGQFDRAIETARRAIRLADEQQNEQLYRALRDELALYELGIPYHQSTD